MDDRRNAKTEKLIMEIADFRRKEKKIYD